MENKPIVNSHTHIFTANDIPRWIAKSFVPWPFYFLLHFPAVFWIFRQWHWLTTDRKSPLTKFRAHRLKFLSIINTNGFYKFLYSIPLLYALINAIYFILNWCGIPKYSEQIQQAFDFLASYYLLLDDVNIFIQIVIVAFIWLYSKVLRKLLLLLGKWVWKPLSFLPKRKTMEFLERYLKIAAITKYEHQRTAYQKLYKMYPPKSKFVVLPMDMEYMGAGAPSRSYIDQLEKLNELKSSKNDIYDNLLPFIFVDPRRIKDPKGGKRIIDPKTKKETWLPFFNYALKEGKIILKDCLLKYYLEKDPKQKGSGHFRGIKIYPALGYYPFDESLLPLWLYCTQRGLPITTHCTVGTIFYRGAIEEKWFTHPVFSYEKKELEIFAEKNMELQRNFTNPLNYLVLLEPQELMRWLDKCSADTQALFGYESNTLKRDLSELKINIAHYGGIEQWQRHLETDRNDVSQEILESPDRGIAFYSKQNDPASPNPFKPAWLWGTINAEWYSIISSMMLQYKNVYADISYILHTPEIRPLLHLTLTNEKLLKKVLFGTDYYVVRNHKSEKELYADMIYQFTPEQMQAMAVANPNRFLKLEGEHEDVLAEA